MEISVIIILLALIQYIGFAAVTGGSRVKYNVPAPKTTGNENWERLYRIQLNTLELLIVFIPAMIIFSWYISGQWAALPGVVFLVGRQLYFHAYKLAPNKRTLGFSLSLASIVTLVIGSLIAVVIKLVA